LKLSNLKKRLYRNTNNKPSSNNYIFELLANHIHARPNWINEKIPYFIIQTHKITINETRKMLNDIHERLAEYILPKILTYI